MEIENLDPPEQPVTVRGRQFTIREHNLDDTGRFVAALQTAVFNQEAAYLRGASAADLYAQVAKDSDLALALVLTNPGDGQPVTPEFIASLTSSQRESLIDLQTTLDGLDSVEYAARIVAVQSFLRARAQRAEPVAKPKPLGALSRYLRVCSAMVRKLWDIPIRSWMR